MLGQKYIVFKVFDEYSQIIINTKTLSYELRLVRNFDTGMSVYFWADIWQDSELWGWLNFLLSNQLFEYLIDTVCICWPEKLAKRNTAGFVFPFIFSPVENSKQEGGPRAVYLSSESDSSMDSTGSQACSVHIWYIPSFTVVH